MKGGLVADQHWTAYGACAGTPPDDLFVEGAAQRSAREVCAACPVRVDCLIDALEHRILFGVWGGMTERERRSLLRRFPDVVSWRDLIETDPSLGTVAIGYRTSRSRSALEPQAAARR
jgi:WhiB family transcriptional regulator, redox-sensing transcriptional regulator